MALIDELRQGKTINDNGQALELRGEVDVSWIYLAQCKPVVTRFSTVNQGFPIIEADLDPVSGGREKLIKAYWIRATSEMPLAGCTRQPTLFKTQLQPAPNLPVDDFW